VRRAASSHLPELFVGLGVVLLVAVGFVAGLWIHSRRAPTTTVVVTAAPPPAPPSPAPLAVESATPFSAVVTWGTDTAVRQRAQWGIDGMSLVSWSVPDAAPTKHHRAVLTGLEPATTYRVLGAHHETVTFVTPTVPAPPAAATAGGAMTLDGQPFVPLIVIGQCPDGLANSLAGGIDIFVAPCSGVDAAAAELGVGRAFLLDDATAPSTAPGIIGAYQPDEPDARGMDPATLPPAKALSGRLTFMTLTSHFYSGADPLPSGRGIYPPLIEHSDVAGFDLYPLQDWCQPDRFRDVFLAQREFVSLAGGRPTYQWIESNGWGCPTGPTAVTPQTVTAEAWLALAGGARGLGFFPPGWEEPVAQAIAGISRTVKNLQPALAAPPIAASVVGGDGRIAVGARALNGAVYVIAVNPSTTAATATIEVPSLAGRWLTVLGESRVARARDARFTDSFAPLGVHLYVAAPG
jgi:hypothetical protein